MKPNEILDHLEIMFPHAACELNHRNAYELLIAVILSAQTTDASVNKITADLFERYPSAKELASASVQDVEGYIRSIGLYHNKANNIIKCAKGLQEHFDGKVPKSMEELLSLDGVGRKTANVVRSVWFDIPSLPVDTHVERVCKRLKWANEDDSVRMVEQKLAKKLPKYRWNRSHHLMIFFGRYKCKAQRPNCNHCPFMDFCRYQKQHKKKPSRG